MAPVTNGKIIFNEVPIGFPKPGKTLVYKEEKVDIDSVPLAPGDWLVKVLVLSVDPYMRERMAEGSAEDSEPGNFNFGVGLVVRSDNPSFKPGDYVHGVMGIVIDSSHKLSWSTYVGALGLPGASAYYGWKEHAHAKQGEVAFVSSGAGAVGSVVVQLAKRDGLKVTASAGSDDKVKYLQEIGADVAFNYKKTDTLEVLKKEGPIDVYWDNVGGPTLDAALQTAATHGRIIVCGMISHYSEDEPHSFKDLSMIMTKTLSINSFFFPDLHPKYAVEFSTTMPKLLANGEISFKEDATRGLQNSAEAILSVYKGTNFGKKVIVVADE
ncbi:alcohol dehydrogenase [Coniophora puteana RWD-64-598 SS2]|uniref:Alcohol dehydrogenase n=1 Tax=Coniophora puteana (strain RWD-64-598) TaxID=741705 RepID=A0A5M3MGM0_CONPW|nr:alcohol dehydrogenase [Coniophora puteana RWD-64-598 SS2]EIW78207.1 alcohol dehydrogenase [Coniophora puteana RWD-64-598 SS2]